MWLSFEGLNHSHSWSRPSDYKEITLFRQRKEEAKQQLERKTIPTSGEISLLIIAFL
jgi:hypothetical protein